MTRAKRNRLQILQQHQSYVHSSGCPVNGNERRGFAFTGHTKKFTHLLVCCTMLHCVAFRPKNELKVNREIIFRELDNHQTSKGSPRPPVGRTVDDEEHGLLPYQMQAAQTLLYYGTLHVTLVSTNTMHLLNHTHGKQRQPNYKNDPHPPASSGKRFGVLFSSVIIASR